MSTRLSVFLYRLRRLQQQLRSAGPTRRSLVPTRSDGPRVTYRVEDSLTPFKFHNLILCLLTNYRAFPHSLEPGLRRMSAENETVAAICPPGSVRGMKALNRGLFSMNVTVPCLKVPAKHIRALTKVLKTSHFKMRRISPVADLAKEDPQNQTHKMFLLDPTKYDAEDFAANYRDKLAKFDVDVTDILHFDVEVSYDNWSVAEVLRAVLPEDSGGVSGFSIIGHIAHLNLKPEVMDYKHLIGEVILDKNSSVKTVVNKLNTIDNTFRNFQMELLAGEDNFITCAKENGCAFEMDFSKVYWNSRLSTEHQRVTHLLNKGDVLYDVFAGVGPFAIPAAKKGAVVHANDLNPHSYSALVNNVKLNNIKADRIRSYNMDGREFIKTVLKQELISRLQQRVQCSSSTNSVKLDSDTDVAGGASASTDAVVNNVTDSTEGQIDSSENYRIQNQEMLRSCEGWDSDNSRMHTEDFPKAYITMNLPALAIEFLDSYFGLLSDFPKELQSHPNITDALPTVVCYCFSHEDDLEADVRSRAESVMRHKLPCDSTVRKVRNVAPHKEMMCLVFRLTPELLFADNIVSTQFDCPENEPVAGAQRMCLGCEASVGSFTVL